MLKLGVLQPLMQIISSGQEALLFLGLNLFKQFALNGACKLSLSRGLG
jgi:hypothetical protein